MELWLGSTQRWSDRPARLDSKNNTRRTRLFRTHWINVSRLVVGCRYRRSGAIFDRAITVTTTTRPRQVFRDDVTGDGYICVSLLHWIQWFVATRFYESNKLSREDVAALQSVYKKVKNVISMISVRPAFKYSKLELFSSSICSDFSFPFYGNVV